MRCRTRNTGQAMTVLLTLTVLLATSCGGLAISCGGSTPTSPTPTTPSSVSSTPTSPTPTTPSSVMGNFGGQLTDPNVFIRLTTDGQMLTAVVSDGTETTISTHLKFEGPVTNNAVNLNDEFGMGGHLVATLTPPFATGTVSYQGNSFSFTAGRDSTDPPIQAGLYQGEQTVSGVHYLADWIVLSSQGQREGIINEQTKGLRLAPALTAQDIASGQVVVPDLGAFLLTLFQSGKPSPTQSTALSVSPGHFSLLPPDPDCPFDGNKWNCTARLTNPGQSDLKWSASTKTYGVTFNPSSGILPAGQMTSVIISLPGYTCTDSIPIFSGPVNSVPVSVGCPKIG